jgi:hypothetical protein
VCSTRTKGTVGMSDKDAVERVVDFARGEFLRALKYSQNRDLFRLRFLSALKTHAKKTTKTKRKKASWNFS